MQLHVQEEDGTTIITTIQYIHINRQHKAERLVTLSRHFLLDIPLLVVVCMCIFPFNVLLEFSSVSVCQQQQQQQNIVACACGTMVPVL